MVSANTCNWYPGELHPGGGWGKSPLRIEEKYQPLFGGKANWHLDNHRPRTKGRAGRDPEVPPLKPCEGPCSIPCSGEGEARLQPWQGDSEESVLL